MAQSESPVRVRFAPSPTGQLHVGNARTALFNWLFARGQKGVFVLRIEDTDPQRSQAEFERQLLEDIRWLGLDWDEGPDIGGAAGPYRQSERGDLYRKYAQELLEKGEAYHCFCTPQDLEAERKTALAEGRQPGYSGKCRALSADQVTPRMQSGQPAAVRLRIPEGELAFDDMVHGRKRFASDTQGDFVLLRSEGPPAYNFAVVVDDHLMKITHVIRGDDHISNTPRQIALYRALGWTPPRFAHLSTILGPDRTRLSKRHGGTSVDYFRELGILPEAMTNYLALLGWSAADGVSEIFPRRELTAQFSFSNITKSPAVFDTQKLFWVNRHYMKESPREELVERALPVLRKAGFVDAETSPEAKRWLRVVLDAVLKNLDHLSELPAHVRFIFHYEIGEALAAEENRAVAESEAARQVVAALVRRVGDADRLDSETFRKIMGEVKKETGQKGKNLFHPIRVALTGQTSGPELDKLIPVFEQGSKLPLPCPVKSSVQRLKEFQQAVLKSSP